MAYSVHSSLETLVGPRGAVTIGWVADRVLYARLEGVLSAELGGRYAARLQVLTRACPSFSFFADARNLREYDLLARSAFIRIVASERRRFSQLTILTWAEGIGPSGRAMVAAIGGDIEMLVDPGEFDRRLVRAAPDCLRLLSSVRREEQSDGQ